MTDEPTSAGVAVAETVRQEMNLQNDSAENWDEDYEINRRLLASSVGSVALCMPFVLFVAGGCFHESISHFYYGRVSGTIFTGALFFIGAFLLAYRSVAWITRLSTVAGICAFGVALFPTGGSGCESGSFDGRPFGTITTDASGDPVGSVDPEFSLEVPLVSAETVHFLSAAVLFLILAFFCFLVFTRILPKHRLPDGSLKPEKALRNRIYQICGVVMLFSLIAIAIKFWFLRNFDAWNGLNLTFWAESLALLAFGVSWVLKGRLGPFSDTAVAKTVLGSEDRALPGEAP